MKEVLVGSFQLIHKGRLHNILEFLARFCRPFWAFNLHLFSANFPEPYFLFLIIKKNQIKTSKICKKLRINEEISLKYLINNKKSTVVGPTGISKFDETKL